MIKAPLRNSSISLAVAFADIAPLVENELKHKYHKYFDLNVDVHLICTALMTDHNRLVRINVSFLHITSHIELLSAISTERKKKTM